ncbi:MAG: DEAD/DEAH box helicase [Bacteroidota bacterium]
METGETGWASLPLNKQLLQAIEQAGFTAPTEIQLKAIPPISGGQQVIGIAQTGTGKTAAYLLPLLMKLRYHQRNKPRAVVLTPTKELVIQIASHATALSAFTDLKTVALYGGVGPKTQIEKITEGVDLIISTPGRLMEIYLKGELPVKFIHTLVIDEADRMMDMNFMPQLRKVFEVLPQKRQNLLFSATFPERVERMSQEFLDFPTRIEVTPQATVARQVSQSRINVPNFRTKLNLIVHLLQDPAMSRVMVFTRTREAADNIGKYMDRSGLGPVRTLHANKGQNSRINAIREFSDGTVRVLVATDVASRGIDIEKVTHVINFDVPVVYDDYVHRTGRTGRAAETGDSVTLVSPADEYHMTKIEALIREKVTKRPFPKGVVIEETPFPESQNMAREIDRQKRREDPAYQGAFHERKRGR